MHPTLLEFEIAGFALLFAALVVLIIHVNLEQRDGQWHLYYGWFSTAARMRRRVGGRWQYRAMTAEEADVERQSLQW